MRLAATVMLVRPSKGADFEVFMLRRSAQSAFAPDAYVFPGGTIDPVDESGQARSRTAGADEAWVSRNFRTRDWPAFASGIGELQPGQAAALAHAALRELYEEADVLLVRGDVSNANRTGLSFDELLQRYDLKADAGALTLFSQWITPPSEPRRYNAYFFLARADESHSPRADAYETHDGVWIAPAEALARFDAGSMHLVYPTIKHLERLRAFDDIDALFEFASHKPIYRVMPDDSGGERRFGIPAELENAW